MTPPLCVITDAHLMPGDKDSWQNFFKLLEILPRPCTLLTLGDFFDFWYRPISDHCKDYGPLLEKLKEASDNDLDIKFIAGNRDFFFKNSDAKKLGITLVEEPYRLTYDNEKLCFLHGDLLLTSDTRYHEFRAFIRKAWVSFVTRHFPHFIIKHIVSKIRNDLGQNKAVKPLDKFEVDLEAAKRYLGDGDFLLCGHTHIPLEANLSKGKLRVLPAFGDKGEFFYKEPNNHWQLKQI